LTHKPFVTFSLHCPVRRREVIEWLWWAPGVQPGSANHIAEMEIHTGYEEITVMMVRPCSEGPKALRDLHP